MIEKPEVGQRVWWRMTQMDVLPGTVVQTHGLMVVVDVDGHGESLLWSPGSLYDSPQSAASALREQAAELIRRADELEQETDHA